MTGARCHTTVIGCVSPCIKDTQQTLNTLRYAESLSPNTGKRSHKPTHIEEDDEEEDDVAPLPPSSSGNSPPKMHMSKQPSVMMMDNELEGEGDDDMSLL